MRPFHLRIDDMLDVMRRGKGLKKVIIGLLVVGVAGSLALAMYGLWGGGLAGKEQGAPDWIANVDGDPIPTRVFQRTRSALENDMRQRFAGQASDEALGSFIDQQALGSVLGQYLSEREAERAGLRVTPAEVSDDIVNSPNWQKDGRFVGLNSYRRILEMNRINVAEFERERQRELAADKLRGAFFSLARVDDAELEKRYRDEVERVDVDYVLLADSSLADAKAPAPAEVQSWFAGHTSQYMTPESRRASYVLFDRESKVASIQVADAEIKDVYEKGKATTYSHPEQRRASHILFKLPQDATPEKDAEIKAKAEEVLARVRAGEDFATVARQSSEDPGSAASGGDLGFFGRNRMVKEFEDATFSLAVGGVSGVVKSPFGYHIIKVAEARAAGVQPFEEVKEEIRRSLAAAKAQEEIRKAAEELGRKLAAQESSFDKSASALGYKVEETGFFAKGEPAGPLGRLPQVEDAVFSLKPGAASAPVAVPQGLAIFSLAEVRAPQPAPFDAVKGKVEGDLKKSRAREKARAIASEVLAASGDLKARVEKRKLEVKSYPQVNRVQPLPPLTEASKAAAFAAPVGAVLGPYESDDGLLLISVKGKSPESPEQASAERAALRRRMLDEERSTLYQAFLGRLEKVSHIDINEGLLRKTRNRG